MPQQKAEQHGEHDNKNSQLDNLICVYRYQRDQRCHWLASKLPAKKYSIAHSKAATAVEGAKIQ